MSCALYHEVQLLYYMLMFFFKVQKFKSALRLPQTAVQMLPGAGGPSAWGLSEKLIILTAVNQSACVSVLRSCCEYRNEM